MPMSISWPTPFTSIDWNGSTGRIFCVRYVPMNPLMSSRLKPNVICVRSFVPNEKNSASAAIWSAVRAARGSSIIVPIW